MTCLTTIHLAIKILIQIVAISERQPVLIIWRGEAIYLSLDYKTCLHLFSEEAFQQWILLYAHTSAKPEVVVVLVEVQGASDQEVDGVHHAQEVEVQ